MGVGGGGRGPPVLLGSNIHAPLLHADGDVVTVMRRIRDIETAGGGFTACEVCSLLQ